MRRLRFAFRTWTLCCALTLLSQTAALCHWYVHHLLGTRTEQVAPDRAHSGDCPVCQAATGMVAAPPPSRLAVLLAPDHGAPAPRRAVGIADARPVLLPAIRAPPRKDC